MKKKYIQPKTDVVCLPKMNMQTELLIKFSSTENGTIDLSNDAEVKDGDTGWSGAW